MLAQYILRGFVHLLRVERVIIVKFKMPRQRIRKRPVDDAVFVCLDRPLKAGMKVRRDL